MAKMATVVPGKMGKHGELSGQNGQYRHSYIVELSKEDVCALENWVKLRMNLTNITTVTFLGSKIKHTNLSP